MPDPFQRAAPFVRVRCIGREAGRRAASYFDFDPLCDSIDALRF